MFVALSSMACSTTVREREVVYVPVSVHRACPCPAPARANRADKADRADRANRSEAYVGRDAVPRTRGPERPPHHAKEKKDGVKWGRVRAKKKKARREVARAERAEIPPGHAKRRQRQSAR